MPITGWYHHDAKEVKLFLEEVKGELCFDIGANGGFLACEVFSPRFTRVVAIEPAHESYDRLAHVAGDHENVTPLFLALSDHKGVVTLAERNGTKEIGMLYTDTPADIGGWNQPDTGQRNVPCTTVDDLASKVGWPDFIKIDTEGHEAYIIDGAHHAFQRRPHFCIEVHDKDNGAHIQNFLEDHELKWERIDHEAYDSFHRLRPHHYWLIG